jgi:hypothetical protein
VPLRCCCWAMAPLETDSDNRVSARKNLCIVFLHSDARELKSRIARSGPITQIANAADRSNEQTRNAGKCGQICGGPIANTGRHQAASRKTRNNLILNDYFRISLFHNCLLQASPGDSYMLGDETWRFPKLSRFRWAKMPFDGDDRSAQLQAAGNFVI